MANSPVVKIGLTFRDRDGNRAVLTCYCSFAATIAESWTLANMMADRAGALSDAVIVQISIAYRYTIDSPSSAGDASNIEHKLLLLMKNADEEVNGMIIPSPRDLFETTGSYAGIRLDMSSSGALAWIDLLESIDLRTQDDRALGTTLVVGGLAL